MESSKLYAPAEFVPLNQSESTLTGRRNHTLWIVIIILVVILSFSSSITYYFEKYSRDNGVYNKSVGTHTERSVSIPQLWFNYKTISEDFCGESRPLQAVPADMILQLNNNAHSQMNFALFLHVEGLIRKHDPEDLRNIFNNYKRRLSSVAKYEDFAAFMKNLNSNQVKFCLNFLKRDTELADFGSYFALVDELSTWYNYLHRLGGYLSSYEVQKRREFYANITEVNFYKFTSETQGKLFRFPYPFNLTRKKLLELNDVIQEWMKPVRTEIGNGSRIFSNKVVLLSEINKKIGDDVHTAYVLCRHTLYLDEDVTLSGVNLGIVAPRWVFLKRVRINLNGVDGPEHEENPKGSGKPGNPGGNAGDFFGAGDWKEDYLVVSANGGRGGFGQNGAKGRDGVNYTHPDPPIKKPVCMSRIRSFKNLYEQTITRYKIFGEDGCGGSGGDGGVGGMGGKGGIIILINESVKIVEGSSGNSGSPGKGGAGGEGGRDGCFYEVFDVNDEVLHRITNVKCLPGNILPPGKPGKDNWNRKGLTQPRLKSNLSSCDCIVNFIRILDFKKDKNPEVISTLRSLNRYGASPECVLKIYDAYKKQDNVELYQILKEEINSKFKNLKSLLLARILILKNNIDYFFIDYTNYLNAIEKSIRNVNEEIGRELQPIKYLKGKIAAKAEKLAQNLKIIKSKLMDADESEEFGAEKKLTCVMLTTIDAMFSLVNKANVEKIQKLNSSLRECLTPDEYVVDASVDIILPRNEKFEVLMIGTGDRLWYLQKLQDALSFLKDHLEVAIGKKKLLKELVAEVEHSRALYKFTEWEGAAGAFFRSVKASEGNKEAGLMRSELSDSLIMLQCKLAEDAARQKTCPFAWQDLRPRAANNKTLPEEVIDRIKRMRESPALNCRNELEAYFGTDSAVGEFYYWPNADVKNEVEMLFSGAEVRLESSLINRHALDKNFIRFKSLNLEFESSDAKRGKLLRDILLDYKMAITHSGYSHYNWRGDTHVVVSEEVTFEYSFKTRENGEPELYNVLYKKVQNGDIVFSPYTTWTIRLTPVNERADYRDLKSYVGHVGLKLTGIGIFIP